MAFLSKFKNLFKKPKKPSYVKTTKGKKPIKKIKPSEKKVKPSVTRKPSAGRKDLREVYKILKEPHISEKATQLSDQGKYTFKVYARANKKEIEKAINNLYGAKVKDINIINIKPKKRILRGIKGRKTGYKKAVVTLKQGEKIEILPH